MAGKVADIFQSAVYKTEQYTAMHEKRLEYPAIIDIEPTNACNMDCIFCARRAMTRPSVFMPGELYKKVIDEVSTFPIRAVRFSGWGEPTLHKNLVAFIRYARDKDVLAHLTTNATLMDAKLSRQILESGLNKIKFSLQGLTEAAYDRMRVNKAKRYTYRDIKQNIESFVELRDKMDVACHVQVSVSVLRREQDDIGVHESFFAYWQQRVDSIWGLGNPDIYGNKPLLTSFQRVKHLTDIPPEDLCQGRPLRKTSGKSTKKCTELYSKISIAAGGELKACCDDFDNKLVVGSIDKQTIRQVWSGDKLRCLREALESGGPESTPEFCHNCDNYF